jgi:methionyl-tRNA formyltransferase
MGLTTARETLEGGSSEFVRQDERAVTYAPKVTRPAARIDWRESSDRIARQTLAYDPAPGAWGQLGEGPIKLFRGEALQATAEPGTILAADDRLLIACGSGAVSIREVQPAGKRRLQTADWVRGHDDLVGQILE